MKKIISIVVTATIIATAVFINSCTKQDDLKQVSTNQSDQAKIVFQKVTRFIDKVKYVRENPGLKSGEELSVDSALWYLGAGFNYEHSKPDDSYISFYRDSSFIQIPVFDGLVNMDDVFNAYFQIEIDALEVFESAPFDEKEQKFTFITIKNIENDIMTLKSTTVTGEKGVADDNPFGPDDDWVFGNDAGKCDEISGDVDAGDLICNAINANRPLYVHDEGKIVIYVNQVTIAEPINALSSPTFINPDDEIEQDNIMDYLLFYETSANCEGCNMEFIDEFYCIRVNEGGNPYYNDMNFYYNGTTDVIYNKIPNIPGTNWDVYGKTFMDIEEIEGTDEPLNNYTIFVHNLKNISYAQRWVIED